MRKLDQQNPTGSDPASKPAPGLYVVATPIGNARDITLRAIDTLAAADLVCCEDTRVTGKLMSLLGLSARLAAYHEHNETRVQPMILDKIRGGAVVALVSDAGMPLVSDPGWRLVRACIDEGLPVTTVPGASASLAALALSGLPCDRFLFAGFLPPKSSARRTALAELAAVPASLIFYESPRRLPEMLADMRDVLGPRPAAVARELTKLFEEVRRDPLDALVAHYAEAGPPRGEVVVVVGPPGEAEAPSQADLDARLRERLARESLRDAVDAVTAATGLPRREVYKRAVALGREETG
jgi:16S rRNA (cytidine1402-2'-O)-methyltransferase